MLTTTAVGTPRAQAGAYDVGLGVAGGLAYSPTEVRQSATSLLKPIGNSFAWGFFVDIPLLATFYISPAAMLYELDLGDGAKPVTDIDLNFKFIVPIGALHLGAGLTAGLTAGAARETTTDPAGQTVTTNERQYASHIGALAYLSYNLLANIDGFVMMQYKRILRDDNQPNITDLHGYLGAMFRF
ncbi:MAG TPA: hypothetical protein VFH51_02460 [Myxococcota bacterium]|nr:hypothetical protein [Myxococcota bacterium]